MKKEVNREFADGLWLGFDALAARLDSIPVGELRSLKLCSETKRIIEGTEQKNEPNRNSDP